MRLTPNLIACLALCLTSCGLRHRNSPVGTLKWYAERAKALGENQAKIIETCMCEDGNLEGVLNSKTYSIVVATPTASATQVAESSIETWYKFRISEILWDASRCVMCTEALPVPAVLSPLSTDELAFPIGHGTAVIEGVKVSFDDRGVPDIGIGQSYLMFLRETLGSSQAKSLGGSEEWIFRLNPDGTLSRASSLAPRTQLSQEVLSLGSLEAVRSYIARS